MRFAKAVVKCRVPILIIALLLGGGGGGTQREARRERGERKDRTDCSHVAVRFGVKADLPVLPESAPLYTRSLARASPNSPRGRKPRSPGSADFAPPPPQKHGEMPGKFSLSLARGLC